MTQSERKTERGGKRMKKHLSGILAALIVLSAVMTGFGAVNAAAADFTAIEDFDAYSVGSGFPTGWKVFSGSLSTEYNVVNTPSENGKALEVKPLSQTDMSWLEIGFDGSVPIPADSEGFSFWIKNTGDAFNLQISLGVYSNKITVPEQQTSRVAVVFDDFKNAFTANSLLADAPASIPYLSFGYATDTGIVARSAYYLDSIRFEKEMALSGIEDLDQAAPPAGTDKVYLEKFDGFSVSGGLPSGWTVLNGNLLTDFKIVSAPSSAGNALEAMPLSETASGWLNYGINAAVAIPDGTKGFSFWVHNTGEAFDISVSLGVYIHSVAVPANMTCKVNILFSDFINATTGNSLAHDAPASVTYLTFGYATDDDTVPRAAYYLDEIYFGKSITETQVSDADEDITNIPKTPGPVKMLEDFNSFQEKDGLPAGWGIFNGSLPVNFKITGSPSKSGNALAVLPESANSGWINYGINTPIDIPDSMKGLSFWIHNTGEAFKFNVSLGEYEGKFDIPSHQTSRVDILFSDLTNAKTGKTMAADAPESISYLSFGYASDDGAIAKSAYYLDEIYLSSEISKTAVVKAENNANTGDDAPLYPMAAVLFFISAGVVFSGKTRLKKRPVHEKY